MKPIRLLLPVVPTLTIALTALTLCTLIGYGFDNSSLSLSDPEYKAVEESVAAREAYRKRFEQASNAAMNAQLKCESAVAALSEYQTSFALKLAAEARFDSVLSAHRLSHSCAECDYAPDFKTLIRPTPKK